MMLKRLLPLALIAVSLAMPPTAAAETRKSKDFFDAKTPIDPGTAMVTDAEQFSSLNFILTSNPAMPDLKMVGLSEHRTYNASRLAATMVVVDQEVSPSGDLAVMITSSTRMNSRKVKKAAAINTRSTMGYPAAAKNDDKAISLVDRNIVSRC